MPLLSIIRLAWCVLWMLCLLPGAQAHLMPAQKGTINLIGPLAYVVVSLPVSAFPELAHNAEGLASASQLQASQTALAKRVRESLILSSGDRNGELAQWQEILLAMPNQDESTHDAQSYILLMGVARFSSPPQSVVVANALLQQHSRPQLGKKEDFLKLSVTRTENGRAVATDAGLLAATHPSYHFFAPVSSVLSHFWRLGLEHIGFGADHLLFLVALLASNISLRRWIVLLTTFTVAHGLTFTIASNGWVTLSSALVEPAIAASIVVIAGMHLTRFKPTLSIESVFVFACGLIHGLGFAAAMQGQGLNEQRPIWSIVGFNLGVETGQLFVALLLFIVAYGARRFACLIGTSSWLPGWLNLQRAVALIAIGIGSYWFLKLILAG